MTNIERDQSTNLTTVGFMQQCHRGGKILVLDTEQLAAIANGQDR
jgi:hypothetical protein